VPSSVETLALWRSLVRNPRFLIVNGEGFPWGFNVKGLGYDIDVRNLPVFTDEELVQAVASKRDIAIPTGKLSDNLFDAEFDIYRTLGSQGAAQKWFAENLWRLEKLGTVIVRSPQYGFHVLGFSRSDSLDLNAITDWLWVVEEDNRVFPDVIHFTSRNRPHYVILPNDNNGREYLTSCRTIRKI